MAEARLSVDLLHEIVEAATTGLGTDRADTLYRSFEQEVKLRAGGGHAAAAHGIEELTSSVAVARCTRS